jgi:EAL and modified HD-GYP domain-containing signal transduction protein
MMDAILGRPIADIVAEIPVTADVKAALLYDQSPLSAIYGFILAYERGDWDEITQYTRGMRMDEGKVTEAYLTAADWAHQAYKVSSAA